MAEIDTDDSYESILAMGDEIGILWETIDNLEKENEYLRNLNRSYEATIRTLTKNLLDKSGV